MKKTIGVLFVLGAALLFAADPAGFAFWSASDLKSMARKLAPKMDPKVKVATENLATYGNHLVMVVYREANGEAELHEKQVDIFVVQSGEGELVLGGEMVGGKNHRARRDPRPIHQGRTHHEARARRHGAYPGQHPAPGAGEVREQVHLRHCESGRQIRRHSFQNSSASERRT